MKYNIERLRNEAGLSQYQLADKAKVSRTIISGLESGRVEVTTTETLRKLAVALDCGISDLFFEKKV